MLPFDTAVLVHVIFAGSGTPARRRPHGKVFPNKGLPKGRQAPIGEECVTEVERIPRQVALSHEFTRQGHRAGRSLGGGRPGGGRTHGQCGIGWKGRAGRLHAATLHADLPCLPADSATGYARGALRSSRLGEQCCPWPPVPGELRCNSRLKSSPNRTKPSF